MFGPARDVSASPQTGTSGAVAVDDGTMLSLVEANLAKSATLEMRDIDVDVSAGFVTLTGTVLNAAEKASAGTAARVAGVKGVINQIEIDPKIDQSKIDAVGDKAKIGLAKAIDATVNAAHKTKDAAQEGVAKSDDELGAAADKSSD